MTRDLSERERQARDYAVQAHGNQRYGDAPYVVHLEAVTDVLAEHDFGEPTRIAGWLHDTLEDTTATMGDIARLFGSGVAADVVAVTGIGDTRALRNANAYGKVMRHALALPVKLADRIANAEASAKNSPSKLQMYREEYPALFEALGRFYHDDPKVAALWKRLRAALGVPEAEPAAEPEPAAAEPATLP